MGIRRKAREYALQALYYMDIRRDDSPDALALYTLTLPEPGARPAEAEGERDRPGPVRQEAIQARLADLTGVAVLFDRGHGQNPSSYWSTIISDLEIRGAAVVETYEEITPGLLSGYDLFWLVDNDYSSWTADEFDALEE